MSCNEPTEEEKEVLKEIVKKKRTEIALKKNYKKKWHPKKAKRGRGLKKGEWKGV